MDDISKLDSKVWIRRGYKQKQKEEKAHKKIP